MRSLRSFAPPVVLNLMIVNCLVLMATNIFSPDFFYRYFALWGVNSPLFKPFQVVTYMFMHANVNHLFFNMFSLWMFGRTLEQVFGQKRFLTYYMVCGISAGLIQLAVSAATNGMYPTVGASGSVFGLLLAFGVLFPNQIIMLLIPPIPIKAKWFVMIYGVIELFLGVSGRQMGVAHFAHLGGMIGGYLLLMYWKKISHSRRR
ncbi:MAG: rhomboid family intramembrane serine protease [Rikenellaceae bacterium]